MKKSPVQALPTTGRQPLSQLTSAKLRASLSKAWLQILRWWELAEQRRKLALLDAHALHDLGLSRADALRESERSFWDDPLAKPRDSADAQNTTTGAAGHASTSRLPS